MENIQRIIHDRLMVWRFVSSRVQYVASRAVSGIKPCSLTPRSLPKRVAVCVPPGAVRLFPLKANWYCLHKSSKYQQITNNWCVTLFLFLTGMSVVPENSSDGDYQFTLSSQRGEDMPEQSFEASGHSKCSDEALRWGLLNRFKRNAHHKLLDVDFSFFLVGSTFDIL